MQHKDMELLNRIRDFVMRYQAREGRSPSYRVVMREFRLNSLSRAHRYIHELEERGDLECADGGGIAMDWRLDASRVKTVPLIGTVPCGNPILAIEDYEGVYKLPEEFTGTGDVFMLKAKGSSMTGAGIRNGDYVVIRYQDYADSGDIVVAMIGNSVTGEEDATLKRYKVSESGHIVLHPENEKFCDIDGDGCRIAGIMVGYYHRAK